MRLLFVCRHGAAKSVLAAELAQRAADELGVDVDVAARGIEPDAELSPRLRDALPDLAVSIEQRPLGVSEADIERAEVVVTFDLDPNELPAAAPVLRWDGIPAVSEDPIGAREAIAARVDALLRAPGRD